MQLLCHPMQVEPKGKNQYYNVRWQHYKSRIGGDEVTRILSVCGSALNEQKKDLHDLCLLSHGSSGIS